jgi:hypothetical protein
VLLLYTTLLGLRWMDFSHFPTSEKKQKSKKENYNLELYGILFILCRCRANIFERVGLCSDQRFGIIGRR